MMSSLTRRAVVVGLAVLAFPMAVNGWLSVRSEARAVALGRGAAGPSHRQEAPAQKGAPELTEFSGPYLGQPRPGTRAVPFAPGFFNKDLYSSVNFSKDGSEAYWSSQGHIYHSRQINGTWTKPEEVVFGSTRGVCPVLAPDGKRLYFNKWDAGGAIVYMERTPGGWSDIRSLPEIVNSTPDIHWNVSVDLRGNLYFTSGRTNRDVKILFSPYKNGEYGKPAPVDELKDAATICPHVAPDGSYLIFVQTDPDKQDKSLYIVFKRKDGGWTTPRNVSDIVGGKGFCPTVSPDGKYLFFFDKGSMYWADASFIDDLRSR
jgi:hypothetical protein